MRAYASHTGTRRNIAAMRAAGWGLILAPGKSPVPGMLHALDNGAWGATQRGEALDLDAFARHAERHADGAQFVVLPDIVAGGLDSLALSVAWIPRLHGAGARRLLAVQDGMKPSHVAPYLSASIGVFVGGSTAWKLATMRAWGQLARACGAYLHVGRVNTARRVRLCQDAGADSFDGTSVTRYATTLPLIDNARRQGHIFGGLPPCPTP